MNIASWMIATTIVVALVMGVRGGRGRASALEQWSVAGRSFGSILVFLLMAGEIYTTFTFLGASGYAYGKGAASYYILCYFPLAYILSYWMLPPIWAYARDHGLVSQAGFFARKYDSTGLGLVVTLVGVVALVPYLVLQLKGLGIIVSTTSYGAISQTTGILVGAGTIAAFVAVSGIHGPAALALIKDALIIVVIVVLGLYLPWRVAGGVGPMFARIQELHPGFLAFPAKGQSVAWFDSTVVLTALGFFMWPHSFCSVFTARDARTLRRNAVAAPLYGLMLLFALFVGFAALMRVPGLTGKAIDLALFKLALAELPPAAVGIIGVAGVLTALVPGAMMVTTASTTLRARHLPAFSRASVRQRGGDSRQGGGAAGRRTGGRLRHRGRRHDRRAAPDGLRLRDPAVSGAARELLVSKPADGARGRGRHPRRGGHRRRDDAHQDDGRLACAGPAAMGARSQHRYRRARAEHRRRGGGQPCATPDGACDGTRLSLTWAGQSFRAEIAVLVAAEHQHGEQRRHGDAKADREQRRLGEPDDDVGADCLHHFSPMLEDGWMITRLDDNPRHDPDIGC